MDAVMSQTLVKHLDEIERIDRLIVNVEARRNAMLREIERHRTTFAASLRGAADFVEEAEFIELPPADEQKAAG